MSINISIRHIFSTSFSVVCSTKKTNTFFQSLLVIQTDKVVYRNGIKDNVNIEPKTACSI